MCLVQVYRGMTVGCEFLVTFHTLCQVINILMMPQPPSSCHLVYCSELKVAQGTLKSLNHHLIRYLLFTSDAASNVSSVRLMPIPSMYILYTIFSRWRNLSRDYNPVSDDRVFLYYYLPKVRLLFERKFLEPIILSYGLSLKFLRGFVDFSGIHVISGYTRMSILVLVFYLTLIFLLAHYFSIIYLQAFVPSTIVC